MADLLFEIFTEEVPARMQTKAVSDIRDMFAAMFKDEGLSYKNLRSYITPRRMTVVVEGLAEVRADVSEERKGPAVSADSKAIDGFLKSTGLKLTDLEKRETPKGEFYFAHINKKGVSTKEVLLEKIPQLMKAFPWPKPMRWADEKEMWIRPIHNMICLFGGEVVPIAYASVTASNCTFGHRFMSPEKITVADFSDYKKKMSAANVILDQEERKRMIQDQCLAAAKEKGLILKEDAGLLDEVCGLCEYVEVVVGNIQQEFMSVPKECLISSMRNHQKYFSLLHADGSLAPYFITISNMKINSVNEKNIRLGNEKVLRARLSDAKFFWDTDKKTKLADRVKSLSTRVFHADIGTMKEKVERCVKLSTHVAKLIGADVVLAERVSLLAKADLSSGMVGEFPELQGIMGKYYALNDGENKEVAIAIEEHYSPQGPNDSVPKSLIGASVALADKIDSLVAFWMIGQKPTGSKDPFALRRAALGVIRIILEHNLRINLQELFSTSKNLFTNLSADIESDLLEFFIDRLKVHLKNEGIRNDSISAVFSNSKDDDFVRVIAKIRSLTEFLNTEDGKNLLVVYARSANILKIEMQKEKIILPDKIDETLFEDASESELFCAIQEIETAVKKQISDEKYTEAMKTIAQLRNFVDNFFTNIAVICEEKKVRINRLKMLSLIVRTGGLIADFLQIED